MKGMGCRGALLLKAREAIRKSDFLGSKAELIRCAETDRHLFWQIISELVESCRNHDFTDIVVLHEHRGEPDGMVVCHLPFGPTAYFGLYNTVSLCPFSICTTRFFFSDSQNFILYQDHKMLQ